jgi:hypothetical protein
MLHIRNGINWESGRHQLVRYDWLHFCWMDPNDTNLCTLIGWIFYWADHDDSSLSTLIGWFFCLMEHNTSLSALIGWFSAEWIMMTLAWSLSLVDFSAKWCYFLWGGLADVFHKALCMTMASIETDKCLVEVTSLKLLPPELYLQKITIYHR